MDPERVRRTVTRLRVSACRLHARAAMPARAGVARVVGWRYFFACEHSCNDARISRKCG